MAHSAGDHEHVLNHYSERGRALTVENYKEQRYQKRETNVPYGITRVELGTKYRFQLKRVHLQSEQVLESFHFCALQVTL